MSVESLIQIKLQLEASGDQATADKIGAALDRISVKEEKLAALSEKRSKALAAGDDEAVKKIEAAIQREINARTRLENKINSDVKFKEAKEADLLAESISKAAEELERLALEQEKAASAGEKTTEQLADQASQVKSAGGSFGELPALITGVNAGLEIFQKGFQAAAAAIGAVVDKGKEIVAFDQLITTLSRSTGAGKESVAAFTQEFVKLGESPEQVKGSFSQFQGFIADALSDPLSDAAKNARLLGINLYSLKTSTQPFDAALKQVSQSTNGFISSFQQGRAAALAFGEDDAPKVIAALNGIDGKIAEVQKRGLVLSPEQSANVERIISKLGTAKETLQGIFTQVLAAGFPIVERGLNDIQAGLDSITGEQLAELQSGLVVTAKALQGAIQLFIDVGKAGVEAFSRITETADALAHPIDTITVLLGGTAKQVDLTSQGANKAAASFGAMAKAGTELESALTKLNNEQSKFLGLFEAKGNAELAIIDNLVKKGLLTEAEANVKRAEYAKKAANERILENTTETNQIRKTIDDESARRRDALQENLSQLQKFAAEKIRLTKEAEDIQDRNRNNDISESPALKQKRFELAELKELQKDALASIEKITDESEKRNTIRLSEKRAVEIDKAREQIQKLEEIEGKNQQADAQRIASKTNEINAISALEAQAAAKTQKLQEDQERFRKVIDTNTLVDAKTLTDEEIKIRNAKIASETNFKNARVAQEKATGEEILAQLGLIDEARDKSLKSNLAAETAASNTLKDQLNSRQINEQQYNAALEQLSISRLTKDLAAEQTRLLKLKETQAEGSALIVESAQKVGELVGQIKDAQRAKDIQALQNQLSNETAANQASAQARATLDEQERTRQVLKIALQGDSLDQEKAALDARRLQQQELNHQAQTLQDLVSQEETRLRLIKAQGGSDKEVGAQEEVIRKKQADADKARADAEVARRAANQQSTNTAIAGLQAEGKAQDEVRERGQKFFDILKAEAGFYNQLLTTLGQAVKVEVNVDSVNHAETELAKLKKQYEEVRQELLEKGFTDVPLQIASDTLAGQIERIEREINETRAKLQAEADAKARAARIASETAANVQILNDLKKELAEEAAAEEAHKEDKQKRLKEIAQTKEDIAKTEEQKAKDNAAALDAIDAEETQKQTDRANQLAEAKFKAAQEANSRISELNKQSRLSELDAEDQFASSQADIRKEIAAKQKELATSTDPGQKKTLEADIKALQDKLKGGADQEEARKKATEKRDKQIADAKLQLDKDLGAATNDAQREAAQKRFDTATQAANDELKVELDYQKAKAKAIADGDAEELKTIDANHIKKLAAIKQAADEQNAITSQTLAHAEEVIAAQAAAEKAAYEKKRADQKQRGDQELADLKTADKAKLDQQIADLAASNQAFKDAEEARKAALAEQIASITGNLGLASGQIQDYIGKLAASLGIAADKIKPIADAIAKITADTKTTNDAASSQANADNGGSPSNSNSILGSPSSTPSGNNPSSGNTPGNSVNPTANITKKPPSNADSNPNQGAGAGTSKGNGQQPGATGIGGNTPNTSGITTEEAFRKFCDEYYKQHHDPNKHVITDKAAIDIAPAYYSLVTAKGYGFGSLKNPKDVEITKSNCKSVISNSYIGALLISGQDGNKGFYNQVIDGFIKNIPNYFPKLKKDEEDQPGSGSLGKGGNFSTPGTGQGGVSKGQGGGVLNPTGTTSRTITGATQPTAKKPDGRDPLRTADNEATKGAGQGIDDLSAGNFAGSAFANVKGSIQNPEDAIAGKKAGPNSSTTPPGGASAAPNMPVSISKAIEQVIVNVNMPPGATIPQLGSGILAALIKELQDNPSAGQQLNQSLNNSSGLANLMMFGAGAIGT